MVVTGLSYCTASAIFEYVQFLYNNFDKLNSTSSIFVDYSKAFDTIDHEILIKKLLLYKFDKNSVKWFTNYLRIDTGGWSVICCALFNEVPAKCSLANNHTLYVIK